MIKFDKTAGFTLLELLVTVAILGVVTGLAAPNLRGLVEKNALSSQANSFSSAISLARSEAIKRNARITLCKRTGSICDTAASWEDGWIIYHDVDEDSIAQDDEKIRVFDPLTAGYSLTDSPDIGAIVFGADGMAMTNGGSGFSGVDFSLCSPSGDTGKARTLSINISGRLKSSQGVDKC